VNVIRRSSLGEISFVDLGADGATSASVAAQASATFGETEMDPSQIAGQDDQAASPTPPVTPDPVPVLVPPNPVPVEPVTNQLEVDTAVEAMRAAHATELERINGIRRIFNGVLPLVEAQAIREGWTLEKAELMKIRMMRPEVPAIHVTKTNVNASVLEAACYLSARLIDIEQVADEQSLEIAAKKFRGGIGLQELLLEAAWASKSYCSKQLGLTDIPGATSVIIAK